MNISKLKIIWSAIEQFSVIVTIIGFGLTLWQIYSLKSSVKKSESAIREFLRDREYDEIKRTIEIVEGQCEKLNALVLSSCKTGINKNYLTTECQNILTKMNKCVMILPLKDDYIEAKEMFKEARKYLEGFLESDCKEQECLKEARTYFESIAGNLKNVENVFVEKKIQSTSHRN